MTRLVFIIFNTVKVAFFGSFIKIGKICVFFLSHRQFGKFCRHCSSIFGRNSSTFHFNGSNCINYYWCKETVLCTRSQWHVSNTKWLFTIWAVRGSRYFANLHSWLHSVFFFSIRRSCFCLALKSMCLFVIYACNMHFIRVKNDKDLFFCLPICWMDMSKKKAFLW